MDKDRDNNFEVTDTTQEKDKNGNGTKNKVDSRSLKKVLLITGVVLALLLIASASYVIAFYSQIREPQRVLLEERGFATPATNDFEVENYFSNQIVNIALLGFDRGWNRENMGQFLFRPDMLAILSINFETDQVSVVRIPRDSYVPIHNRSGFHDKINHSFFYGYHYGGGEDRDADGIQFTLETVSNVLGNIPIHYYVSVDMYSVIELVDAMGGIYFEVEETIYDKHWNIGAVLVPEGPQIMDGKTYLRYLQYRDDNTRQDIGRIDRQMDLLKHTYFYLKEEGKLTDIPSTYRLYKDYVDTDLSYKQIAALAYYGKDYEATDENLRFYTIPGRSQTRDGIYYSVIIQDERLRIIEEVFGLKVEAWPPIVLVDSPEYLARQEGLKRFEELVELLKLGTLEEDEKIELVRELWKLKYELEIDDEEFAEIIEELIELDENLISILEAQRIRAEKELKDRDSKKNDFEEPEEKPEEEPEEIEELDPADDQDPEVEESAEDKPERDKKAEEDTLNDDELDGEDPEKENEEPVVSTGIVIPDLRGLEIEAAVTKLEGLGLEIGETYGRYYLLLDEGLVINSKPFAGKIVEPASTIDLIYSMGPPPDIKH